MAEGAALAVIALLFSCRGPTQPGDISSPIVEILFPSVAIYDRDGDALVDVELQLSDTGSGIDPATVTVTSSRPAGPGGRDGSDLLTAFAVVTRDSSRIVLEETTDALLPGGTVVITVRVRDRKGNEGMATRTMNLPAGAYHRTLLTGLSPLSAFPFAIAMMPDGSRGYFMGPREIIPFDPYTMEVLPWIPTGANPDPAGGEYDPLTQRFYIANITTPSLIVLDPGSGVLENPIPITGRGPGLEQSPSGLLYVALHLPEASIAVVDPAQRRQVGLLQTGVLDPLNPGSEAFIGTPRIPLEEDRLYVPLGVSPGGVLVIENPSGRVIQTIDPNPSTPTQERPVEMVLDRLADALYVAVGDRPGGMAHIDIRTNAVTRFLPSSIRGAKFPTMSPSSRRLFVSLGGSPGEAPENWLVDVSSWTILQRFFPTNVPSSGDNDSVFRPDGQLIFVVHNVDIGVYLNRE